ncbi:uncharacterized protein BO97DRAFT_425725 [Aspergillus homomorphus CBS 101889]|uniref:TRP C-terminal domain-containing protein n=1 Tax=Aspergillus homomorphus (strain CBS 101889) TaxID=1450537 RepID=A0A395HUM8_ASPHC|nr:hypothetical protein BO97DRAFT_425725 [Aspergillus homomorphus CBS 101889]RAL11095.1 hypothetical protein BO97DRAFT_425725 [Aspergillus homomorphus CBS 101889]
MSPLLLWALLLSSAQAAFVRGWECSPASTALTGPHVFRPQSLSGYLVSPDHEGTTLFLKFTGDFTSDTCDSFNGSLAQLVVDASVLGHPVGFQGEPRGRCAESPYQYNTNLSNQGNRKAHMEGGLRRYAIYETSYYLNHTYALHTLDTTVQLQLEDQKISCTATHITPYIGSLASKLLKALPFVIMVLFGITTAPLKVLRANGRSMFRYELADLSRDPAQSHLRGLGDCLHFLQFIFLSSCLTLSYPGFFRAIAGQLAWSSLIFRNWPVTHDFTYPGVNDGFYATNSTWGLEEMTQVLGGTVISDLWVNAIVNLVLVIVGIIVLVQVPFGIQWVSKTFRRRQPIELTDLQEESVTQCQRTGWSILRTVLDYFLLPLVTFSSSQFLIASWFPVYRTFFAVLIIGLLTVSLGFTIWYLVKSNRQGAFFQESLVPNRYSGSWMFFVLYGIPLVRGIAIGALQQSGLVQTVVLMVCETLNLACLLWNCRDFHAWRPVCFSLWRFASLAMTCVFLPQFQASERDKGLIAYSILFLHAAMLFFGFFVPSVSSIVLFTLRELGITQSHGSNLVEPHQAPVFGIGQLSQRSTRKSSFTELPELRPAAYPQPMGPYTTDAIPSYFRAPRPVTPKSSSSRHFTTIKTQSHSESESGDSSLGSVDLSVLDEDTATISGDGDYSKREADQYYGRPMASQIGARVERMEPSRSTVPDRSRRWPWAKKKTKGFEVVRPARPGM